MDSPSYQRVPSNEQHLHNTHSPITHPGLSPPRGHQHQQQRHRQQQQQQQQQHTPPRKPALTQFDIDEDSPPRRPRHEPRSYSSYLSRPQSQFHPHRVNEPALAYYFQKRRQFFWVAAPVFGRFLLNCALWAVFIFIILFTERSGSLDRDQKHLFNAASVGVPLMLGLNYNSAFKGMAEVMRWKVLASGAWSVREADLILSLHSYLAVTRLSWFWFGEYLRKSQWMYLGRSLAATGWVLLMLGSQVGAGLLGLTYDFNSENALIIGDGPVWVSDLYSFNSLNGRGGPEPSPYEEQYRAHQFGDFSDQLLDVKIVDPKEKIDNETASYSAGVTVFRLRGTADWVYQFQDWTTTPEYPTGLVSVSTNRTITVSTVCSSTDMIRNKTHPEAPPVFATPDAINTTLWNFDTLLPQFLAADGITYINPQPTGSPCGPRCAIIGAVAFDATKRTGAFSDCKVEVSIVRNGLHKNYTLADTVARLAAGAIGLDGVPNSSNSRPPPPRNHNRLRSDKNSTYDSEDEELWYQFARYNNGTTWGAPLPNKNDSDDDDSDDGLSSIASRISRFAIGSIALLDNYNYQGVKDVPGRRVTVGVNLAAKHTQLYLVAAVLLAIHLALIPIVLWLGNSVLVRDTSALALAKLLRPLMEELGEHGCAASGMEIGEALGIGSVTYGVREDGGWSRNEHGNGNGNGNRNGVEASMMESSSNSSSSSSWKGRGWHVELSSDVKRWGMFPNGWYDGTGPEGGYPYPDEEEEEVSPKAWAHEKKQQQQRV